MTLVNAPITWLSILTFIGTTLGVLCVLAINAAKSVNGVLGILSAICFIIVGFSAKNYLSIGEQLAYVITLDIPVLLSTDWNVNMVSKIRKFTAKSWAISIIFTLAVYLISGFAIKALTNEPRPFYDAFSFAVCLTAGIICFPTLQQPILLVVSFRSSPSCFMVHHFQRRISNSCYVC